MNKSFRLDRESFQELPAVVAALAIFGVLYYFDVFSASLTPVLIISGVLLVGYLVAGGLHKQLQSRYPNAAHTWLLVIGFAALSVGVAARMLLPSLQGGWLDYLGLAISFITILTFILINRRDSDVVS